MALPEMPTTVASRPTAIPVQRWICKSARRRNVSRGHCARRQSRLRRGGLLTFSMRTSAPDKLSFLNLHFALSSFANCKMGTLTACLLTLVPEPRHVPSRAADDIAGSPIVTVGNRAAHCDIMLVCQIGGIYGKAQSVNAVAQLRVIERVSGHGQRAVRRACGDAGIARASAQFHALQQCALQSVIKQKACRLLRHKDRTMPQAGIIRFGHHHVVVAVSSVQLQSERETGQAFQLYAA